MEIYISFSPIFEEFFSTNPQYYLFILLIQESRNERRNLPSFSILQSQMYVLRFLFNTQKGG